MRLLTFSVAIALCTGFSMPALAQQTSSSALPTCASGDPVVWINTNTKKYHMQGDSYYGKTKQGKYSCKSAADAAGDTAAKMRTSKSSGATTGTNMNTGSTRAPMSSGTAPGTNMNSGSTHAPMSSGAAPGTNMNAESAPSPAPSAMGHHKHKQTSSGASTGTNMNTDESAPSPEPSATMGHHKHHHTSSGATTGTNMNTDESAPSPEPSATMGHKRHHKKMSASPSPDMTPSPAAT